MRTVTLTFCDQQFVLYSIYNFSQELTTLGNNAHNYVDFNAILIHRYMLVHDEWGHVVKSRGQMCRPNQALFSV